MVEISVVDNLAKIKSDKSIFSVNCIPAIDYPNISFNDIINGQEFSNAEPQPSPAVCFCSRWRFRHILPADSSLSLDLLRILFVAIANMVRGSQRVSNVSCGLVSHFTDSYICISKALSSISRFL